MTTKEINKSKTHGVRVDKSLDKYDDMILFPEKHEKASQRLKEVGLPKQWTSENNHG